MIAYSWVSPNPPKKNLTPSEHKANTVGRLAEQSSEQVRALWHKTLLVMSLAPGWSQAQVCAPRVHKHRITSRVRGRAKR